MWKKYRDRRQQISLLDEFQFDPCHHSQAELDQSQSLCNLNHFHVEDCADKYQEFKESLAISHRPDVFNDYGALEIYSKSFIRSQDQEDRDFVSNFLIVAEKSKDMMQSNQTEFCTTLDQYQICHDDRTYEHRTCLKDNELGLPPCNQATQNPASHDQGSLTNACVSCNSNHQVFEYQNQSTGRVKSRKGVKLDTKSKEQVKILQEFYDQNRDTPLHAQSVKELAAQIGLTESKTYKWLWDRKETNLKPMLKRAVKLAQKGKQIFKIIKV